MKKILILLVTIFFAKITYGQDCICDSIAIDSVFQFHFKVLKAELSDFETKIKYKELYAVEYDSILQDTIMYSEYIESTILFMENITGIELPNKEAGSINAKYLTIDTVSRWEKWYYLNIKFLCWDNRHKKVIIK